MFKKPASISGKQQRPTFSDSQITPYAILPEHLAKRFLSGETSLQSKDWTWGLEINGKEIPRLEAQWMECVEGLCPAQLSDPSRQKLAIITETYLHKRFALATSVSYSQLTETLTKIENAARILLAASEISGQAEVEAWRRIESSESPPLLRDDVYPLISKLVRRSYLAVTKTRAQLEKSESTLSPVKVWTDFAMGLISVFKANDWDVKISKSGSGGRDDHPSIFVNFACAVMMQIPKELREHCSDKWALADALNLVRAIQKRDAAQSRLKNKGV
jgi:hypothetical protein